MAKKLTPIVTPVGELWYVNITGQGKENYNEDGYDYVATVNLTGEAAEATKAKIEAELGEIPKDAKGNPTLIVKSRGWRELLKDADGVYTPTQKTVERDKKAEKTGIFAFTFKTGVTFEDGRTKKVAVYNKDAQKVEMGNLLIGNGSKGAISGKMERVVRKDEVMVSLYLNAVQLTEFIPYSGDAGFETQEGGSFTAVNDAETGFTGSVDKGAASPAAAQPDTTKAKPRL